MDKWKYKESFLLSISILFIGFIIQIVVGDFVHTVSRPYNYLILALIILFYGISKVFFSNTPIYKYLSSKYAAISFSAVFAVLVLFKGLVLSNASNLFLKTLGLNNVTATYPFVIISTIIIIIIGFATIEKVHHFKLKNIGFILNHLGIWLVLIAAGLGKGDMYRLNVILNEGSSNTEVAFNGDQAYKIPFAIELVDFTVEEYPNKIYAIKNEQGLSDRFEYITEKDEFNFNNFNIKKIKEIEAAYYADGVYYETDQPGNAYACFVEITNTKTANIDSLWLSAGSYLVASSGYRSLDSTEIFLLPADPKQYYSTIKINNNNEILKVSVNHPHRVKNWFIYQKGYNADLGKWSKTSILELVRDPWIYVTYTGFLLLILGSIYMLFFYRKKEGGKDE